METTLPRWFFVPLAGALAFIAAAGLIGTALLVVDAYQPLAVLGLAAVAGLASALAVAKKLPAPSRAANGPALAALGVALLFLAMTGVMHSEHLLVERDPGVYLNAGRSLAGTRMLTPRVRSGPYDSRKYVVTSQGFTESSGKLEPSFLPMLPILLALGWTAGGYAGFFLVVPLLGALGLLIGYALSTRLLGARWALLVPLLLAINPLQSWFARDAYSEMVVQVLALGGLWLYLETRATASRPLAAISGVLIASCVVARYDALAIVAAIVGFAALE